MTEKEKQQMTPSWWMYLVLGIVAIFIGWFLLVSPVKTVPTLIVLLGLYWLVSGIVEVFVALFNVTKDGSQWGWTLFGGILGIVAGLIVLNNPLFVSVITPLMFMYLLAFVFIINGVIRMVAGKKREEPVNNDKYLWSWGGFFLGLVYLLFGIVLLASPTLLSVASVLFAAALLMIVSGVSLVIFSFSVKKLDS